MDFRILALVLKQGSKTAADWQDPALSRALGDMAEVTAQYAMNPDGDLFNVERDFAEFAESLGL